jgi:hypothetical protein
MQDSDTSLVTTRESLHTLACYVMAPASKARTGRIGLRPVEGGFGTPLFDDGTCVAVRDGRLVCPSGHVGRITTLREAADRVEVPLAPDPGVGADLPPFDPDATLEVDAEAAQVIADWFALGAEVLERLHRLDGVASVGEPQLWPEHFDLAAVVDLRGGARSNVGFSPGDRASAEPYVYIGPYDTSGLDGAFWNAPFGALLPRSAVVATSPPAASAVVATSPPAAGAVRFVAEGLRQLVPQG